MGYSCSPTQTNFSLHSLPSPAKSIHFPHLTPSSITLNSANRRKASPPPTVLFVAARAGFSHCEPSSSSSSSSSLNTPLEPCSAAGKFLSSVFQNQRQLFDVAVAEELKLLADDRNDAVSRMLLGSRSDEAFLHRRIAQLKEEECQIAVEDVMYMLIFSKFSEIRVPMVPKLSRCIYNSRLEIGPSKDWELESIHSFEVLEMIREHVCTVIGLRANCSVTDSWATTEIQRLQLGRVYAASVLYGYFLKSASSRHYLETCLAVQCRDVHFCCKTDRQYAESLPQGLTNHVFGGVSNMQSASTGLGSNNQVRKCENLRCYVMGFDAKTLKRCAKLKSKGAKHLIEKHTRALFGDDTTGLMEDDDVILTSFSSLKRLVLEAVAFGSFLWDAEEYVNSVFRLNENE